jgi:L-rhamnose mutarotase
MMYKTEYRVYAKYLDEPEQRLFDVCETREEADQMKAYYEADDDKEWVQVVEIKV